MAAEAQSLGSVHILSPEAAGRRVDVEQNLNKVSRSFEGGKLLNPGQLLDGVAQLVQLKTTKHPEAAKQLKEARKLIKFQDEDTKLA